MSFPPAVGRYRIERVLGSGAFASVWLGHDEALDSQVAIKVLTGSLVDDLDVRNRFLEEARILRRADSGRLVRVHDIGELPDRRPYFVMSYADRGTLGDRMRERPLPVPTALALAEEIAYGVEVINALGIIHRDLKPSNVLFQSTRDGGEKLLIADLGLAKALAHASGAFTLPVGTPGYMSPEQARFGGGLDVRADVYGLGALAYHMLTGRAPGHPPVRRRPSEVRPELPPAVDAVLLRALAVERDQRYPTAEAFAEALAELRAAADAAHAPAGLADHTVFDGVPSQAPVRQDDDEELERTVVDPPSRRPTEPPRGTAVYGSPPFDAASPNPFGPGPDVPPPPGPSGFGPPGPPGPWQGAAPAAPRKGSRRALLIGAAAAPAVVLVGVLVAVLLSRGGEKPPPPGPPKPPADFAAVADPSGKIRFAAPKAWPRDAEATWAPSSVGLADAQPRPVLRATPDAARFKGDGAVPGVFVGLTTDAAAGKLPPPSAAAHPHCTKAPPENYTSPDRRLSGTITRFTGCTVGTPSVAEIGLRDRDGAFGAWIRVKETDDRALTGQILDTLRLTAP
ncbi:serine/threonine-protein kinase [Actinomadura flavalba]|uniref:serine/threonine-protein kinase n=1 Tax=Actinomadura flavalba TaxID=1120938 RepID=UPI00036C3FD6|nr:serine/threonine-protein kinase [Actinomadura flavalba]